MGPKRPHYGGHYTDVGKIGEQFAAIQRWWPARADGFDMSGVGTNAAESIDRPLTGAERRRSKRERHDVDAILQPADGNTDAEEKVAVRDLSLGGVGIVCSHPYRVDSVWRITLGNGPLFLNAKVRVVGCRVRADKRFDVGCEFC